MSSSRSVSLPTGAFTFDGTVPGDKSLSHRSFIFSALAAGQSEVVGAGTGQDVQSTCAVLRSLGVEIDGTRVRSPGAQAWAAPNETLDCGNSGTTIRLLAGALGARPFVSTLTGDRSLRRRPMRRLIEPLCALGVAVEVTDAGTAPFSVSAPNGIAGTDVTVPMASAQLRSAVALAAVQGEGTATIDSPGGFRDHTERWLGSMGLGDWETATRFRVEPGVIPAGRYEVPGDPSSAAYLWAAAAIRRGSSVTIRNVSLNPGRIGFLQVLEMFGATVHAEVTRSMLGDPVGDVTVTGNGLFNADVGGELSASSLDELPLIGVLAALGEGITTIRDAAELRAKESDRIATTVALIRALGGGAEETDDGFVVIGTGFLEPGRVVTDDDHRIAMAAAVAAVGVDGEVVVEDADVAAVSWPTFYEDLQLACMSGEK